MNKLRPYHLSTSLGMMFAAVLAGIQPSLAAEFVVSTNADTGAGSLRDAVEQANALPGADTILISEGLDAIELDTGQIDITDSLTIIGADEGSVIDGDQSSRIFGVTVSDISVRLERLVLIEGWAEVGHAAVTECGAETANGGAVCSLSPLEIIDSRIVDNFAISSDGGGVWIRTPGSLRIENTTLSFNLASDGNGGAIFAATEGVTLINTRVIQNTATGANNDGFTGAGGGIYYDGDGGTIGDVLGDLTIERSELSGNGASGLNGDGGAIWVQAQTRISNSTLSGNRTTGTVGDGGAIYSAGGNTVLTDTTITQNTSSAGGAVEIDDGAGERTLRVEYTVLSGNDAPAGNLLALGGVIVNMIASVFGDSTGEVNGSNAFNEFTNDPGLDPLSDNGCFLVAGVDGPFPVNPAACVQTHAVGLNSPALDRGNPAPVELYDQRGQGFPRITGSRTDIGAFELTIFQNPPEGPGDPGIPINPEQPTDPNFGQAVPVPVDSPFGLLALSLLMLWLGWTKMRLRA
jgi:hypothetical protein